MGTYVNNNKVSWTDGVDFDTAIAEIAALLEVNPREDGYYLSDICSSDNINMMSKVKPVRRTDKGPLTGDMFEGDISDIRSNIHFGIKIPGSMSAEIGPELVQIHNTAFEYIRPKIGDLINEKPILLRLGDFNGYDHRAISNPGASFGEENLTGYYNDGDHQRGSLQGITVGYDSHNTTGVDFTDMFKDSSESLINNLKRSYPCILVTDSVGNSYFTALDFPSESISGTDEARPLYYNNSYQKSSNWSVRFDKPKLDTGMVGTTIKPWNSPQENMKASLFLVKSADINGPYLDFSHSQNFSTHWVPINSPILISAKPIVLPSDKFGVSLTLSKYGISSFYIEPTDINATDNLITFVYNKVGEFTEPVELKAVLTLNGISCEKTVQINNALMIVIPSFIPSDFGLLTFSLTTYNATVTFTTTDGNGSTTKMYSDTITVA